jgi:Lipase (class 3)
MLLPGTLKNLFYPPEKAEYTYFQRAGDFPFLNANNIVQGCWAADAAMLSYARYGCRRMEDDELKENLARGGLELQKTIGVDPDNWNAPGTQAFFATGPDFAVLAFRGTEVDDPANSRSDLDIVLVHEPDYRGGAAPALWHLSMIQHLFSVPCLVHQGFQRALNSVWEQVYGVLAAYRAQNPAAEICITGHSLGGALALLTYSRCSDPKIAAYTFGCPRVGNTAFRERVDSNVGMGHFRCVNFNDLVTHVPLESALYVHAPQECYRFDDSGKLDRENDGLFAGDLSVLAKFVEGLPADIRVHPEMLAQLDAPPGLVDHSPARYCMRLWGSV